MTRTVFYFQVVTHLEEFHQIDAVYMTSLINKERGPVIGVPNDFVMVRDLILSSIPVTLFSL